MCAGGPIAVNRNISSEAEAEVEAALRDPNRGRGPAPPAPSAPPMPSDGHEQVQKMGGGSVPASNSQKQSMACIEADCGSVPDCHETQWVVAAGLNCLIRMCLCFVRFIGQQTIPMGIRTKMGFVVSTVEGCGQKSNV